MRQLVTLCDVNATAAGCIPADACYKLRYCPAAGGHGCTQGKQRRWSQLTCRCYRQVRHAVWMQEPATSQLQGRDSCQEGCCTCSAKAEVPKTRHPSMPADLPCTPSSHNLLSGQHRRATCKAQVCMSGSAGSASVHPWYAHRRCTRCTRPKTGPNTSG
jgi:hypothetical protein